MIVTCPNCAHDFEKPTLDVQNYHDDFEALLTSPAKRVFNTTVTACDFMTLFCPVCKTEEPVALEQQISMSKYGTLLSHEDVAELWPAHVSHEVAIKTRHVQFLSGFISVSLAAALVASGDTNGVINRLLDKRFRILAHIFNTGVAEGWIKYGVLAGPMVVDMAVLDPALRKMVGLYVGTHVPIDEKKIEFVAGRDRMAQIRLAEQKWLNDRLGAPLFVQEGELGTETEWERYAELHNIA